MKSQSTIGRKKFIIYDLKAEQSTTRHLQFISILLAVLLLTVVVVPYYMDIRPVRAAPTEITTIDGLYAIRNTLSGDYVLMNDLDFNDNDSYTGTGEQKNTKRLDNTSRTGDGWMPIGVTGARFSGTFDGQGYTISNLFINRTSTDSIGLFGYSDTNTEFVNITLVNVNVSGKDSVGSLIGRADGTDVSFCLSSGSVSGSNYTGGLIGWYYSDTADNSSSSCNVSGYDYVGGFVGAASTVTISYCHATGSVSTTHYYAGGFAGGQTSTGTIQYCYATGNVTGSDSDTAYACGGFVGRTLKSGGNSGVIKQCYATGNVSTQKYYAGGFVGIHDAASIFDCYATGSVTRRTASEVRYGGFSGRIDDEGVVNNSYSIGAVNVTGAGFTGDVVAGGAANNCFWDNQTSGQTGSSVGTGKNTVDMKTLATFTGAGWDMVAVESYDDEIWYIDAGNDYPRLWWEYESPVETNFSLVGLTDSKITWYGMRGESVWCNSSGIANETLQIQISCNASINVTNIDIYLTNMSYSGNYLSASNVTMYVSSNNNDFGSLGAFVNGGSNISINASTWNAGTMGTNPFPIGPSESFTIYVRFLLAIPNGVVPPDGTYVSTGFKVYLSGYS